MKLKEAVKILRQHTLQAYWPNPKLGINRTDLAGIGYEILNALRDIKARQGIDRDAKFFVLDESHSETKLYNKLAGAWNVFYGAVRLQEPRGGKVKA